MSLPDADCEPVRGPLPGSPGYAARFQTGMAEDVTRPRLGWGLLASAALVLIGWLGPWVYIDSVHLRLTGPHLLSLPLTTALVLAAAGVLVLRRRGHTWVSVIAIIVSVVLFVLMTVSVGSICDDQASKRELPVGSANPGWGLWVTTLAALCAVVVAVLAVRRRDVRPREGVQVPGRNTALAGHPGMKPGAVLLCLPTTDRRRRQVTATGDGRAVHLVTGHLADARTGPSRVAMLSVHTSPLDPPGGGDAGGMNVYIVEVAKRLATRGVEVEIFTRATASDQPPLVTLCPGVHVRHVTAGPFEGLAKADLPAQLCAFTAGVMRAEVGHEPGWYDLVHSHYWLSGQVGWLARERWGVPLVHTAHTLAKVKNLMLAAGDEPEPRARVIGEEQVVNEADRLIASTAEEAAELVELYGADPRVVRTIAPGVDLDVFCPAPKAAARARLGLRTDALTLLFVGRIQPLKAPDVLVRAAALLAAEPDLAGRLQVVVLGAPSGSGLAHPRSLESLRDELGLRDIVQFRPPVPREVVADHYRAADLTVVPSYNESFGLVALESQACGTPVVAAAVGGLSTAVADDASGVLVDGHDPQQWAKVLADLLRTPAALARLAAGARPHAARFSWDRTAAALLDTYRLAITDRQRTVGGAR